MQLQCKNPWVLIRSLAFRLHGTWPFILRITPKLIREMKTAEYDNKHTIT